jgi:hypothetical protein
MKKKKPDEKSDDDNQPEWTDPNFDPLDPKYKGHYKRVYEYKEVSKTEADGTIDFTGETVFILYTDYIELHGKRVNGWAGTDRSKWDDTPKLIDSVTMKTVLNDIAPDTQFKQRVDVIEKEVQDMLVKNYEARITKLENETEQLKADFDGLIRALANQGIYV